MGDSMCKEIFKAGEERYFYQIIWQSRELARAL